MKRPQCVSHIQEDTSNHMTARDSNRGCCCWDYDLVQTVSQHKDAKELPLFQEGDAHFAMSPKDLNLILSIPK